MRIKSIYSLVVLLGGVMLTQNVYAMAVKVSEGHSIAVAGMKAIANGLYVLGIGISVAGIAVGIGVARAGKHLSKQEKPSNVRDSPPQRMDESTVD